MTENFEEINAEPKQESDIAGAETAQTIVEIIQTLPLEQRSVVYFHYCDGLDTAQIAEKLAVSEEVIGERLATAQEKIREELEKRGDKEGLRLWMAAPLMVIPALKLALQGAQITASAASGGAVAAGTAATTGATAGTTTAATATGGAAATGATATGGAATIGTGKIIAASVAAVAVTASVITGVVLLGGDDEDDLSDMPVPSAIVLNYSNQEITDEQLISIVEVVQEIETTRIIPDDLEFTVLWPHWQENIDRNDIDAVAEFYGFSDDYISISEYIRQYEEELRNTRILPDDVFTGLDLSANKITDISVLSNLPNLTYLNIRGSESYYDYELESYSPAGGQISDISAVSGLTNLTWLWIGSNQISDISALAGLTNLTYLWIGSNQISDISAVSGLTNLTYLLIGENQISDISAVSGLTNLTLLWISGNQISDISAVSGLTNLTYLWIYGNQISDISAVAGLTNLTLLNIGSNQISDINAVSGLTNLEELYLWGNQLSDAQIDALQEALPGCNIQR